MPVYCDTLWRCVIVCGISPAVLAASTAALHRYEREHLLNILDSVHKDYRPNFVSENVFPIINSTRPTSEIHHAMLYRTCKRGRRGGALCRFRLCGSRPPLPAIVLANVRSLKNQTDELFHLLSFKREFKDSSILCFTETWLDPLTLCLEPTDQANYRARKGVVEYASLSTIGGAMTQLLCPLPVLLNLNHSQ